MGKTMRCGSSEFKSIKNIHKHEPRSKFHYDEYDDEDDYLEDENAEEDSDD